MVRHMGCKTAVAVYHALTEAFVSACDDEGTFAVGVSVWKQFLEMLFIPGEKNFREFMVIDGIGIRRISNPNIIQHIGISRIFT